jgi:hypothetical protein
MNLLFIVFGKQIIDLIAVQCHFRNNKSFQPTRTASSLFRTAIAPMAKSFGSPPSLSTEAGTYCVAGEILEAPKTNGPATSML